MSSSKTAYVQPRVTRSSNRLCSERMDKAAYDLHKKRLSQVRPTIDNKTPAKPLHVVRNWKREQILDGAGMLCANVCTVMTSRVGGDCRKVQRD